MEQPLRISYHNVESTDAIEQAIRQRVEHLDRHFDRIVSCRVVVDQPHHRHETGNTFHVRIDVHVPGAELVVNREHAVSPTHQDVFVAIHDAFEAADRQVQDYARRMRGETKLHNGSTHARVVKLFSEDGYGFLEDADLRQVYFHKNSVLDGAFAHMEVGSEVRYVEEMGNKGPQASTVSLVAKPRS